MEKHGKIWENYKDYDHPSMNLISILHHVYKILENLRKRWKISDHPLEMEVLSPKMLVFYGFVMCRCVSLIDVVNYSSN